MQELEWWQTAVFYQIYPRSFADGNGDGIGDFEGMIERLDYLQELGIDAIWLSPFYPSPQFDCGYDVADYTAVDPEYGTLDDFKRFLARAHERGIRVILDLVLNHTSDQHGWFLESRSSRDNPKRDWYVWRDGRNGGPPNNWHAIFSDYAWEYDPATEQYYYHFFFKEQPDLNWRNPEVKQAMFDAVRFWLDLGVDGFRLDAIGTIYEEPTMADHTAELTQRELFAASQAQAAEPNETRGAYLAEQWKEMYRQQSDQPGVHELMQELRALVDEYDGRVLVGETEEISYYGNGRNELHMVFNFPLMRTERLTPAWIRANQEERLAALPAGAWPCNTLGNHDSSRLYSHYGDGKHDGALARLHLALMLTLPGTPFLYNGEELGMGDWKLAEIGQFRDNVAVWQYGVAIEAFGLSPAEALAVANNAGRDKCRTPMQWGNGANGGFSPAGVATWLPVNPNYADGVNVAEQAADPDSILNFYRRLLHLRKETPALMAGDYQPVQETAEDYLAFVRETAGQRVLVVLNFSERLQVIRFDLEGGTAHLLYSSEMRQGAANDLSQLTIAPFEIYIAELGGNLAKVRNLRKVEGDEAV
jgi:alpha-glucosidase